MLITFREWAEGEEEASVECKVSLRGSKLFFENEKGSFDIEISDSGQLADIKQKMEAMTSGENAETDMAEPTEVPDTPDGSPPMVKTPMGAQG